ncbi:MAG: hypothetical protein RMJ55_05745 [Roseiflexaceae bacterium]|nr:hypothetical protein [Roseiflexus sp.]MDW8213036.1 hypothetical protein [Roseiflexaceae bacterium]
MNDYLSASMPRRLRLRASVQIAGMRLPARAFLMGIGVMAIGGIAISLGADIERTIWVSGGLIVIGLAVLEGRVWGRSSRDVAGIVWRHLNRPKRLRLSQPQVTLPSEEAFAPAVRLQRPHWQRREGSDER